MEITFHFYAVFKFYWHCVDESTFSNVAYSSAIFKPYQHHVMILPKYGIENFMTMT